MLRKKVFWIGIPVLVVAVALLGGCRHPSPEKMADRAVGKLTAELELNAAQQEQLRAVKADLLGKLAQMKKARKGTHDTLMAELQKDVLDRDALKKMAETRRANMAEISDLMMDRLVDFHGTLSPEQKKKLVQLIQDKVKRHKAWSCGD